MKSKTVAVMFVALCFIAAALISSQAQSYTYRAYQYNTPVFCEVVAGSSMQIASGVWYNDDTSTYGVLSCPIMGLYQEQVGDHTDEDTPDTMYRWYICGEDEYTTNTSETTDLSGSLCYRDRGGDSTAQDCTGWTRRQSTSGAGCSYSVSEPASYDDQDSVMLITVVVPQKYSGNVSYLTGYEVWYDVT